MSFKLSFGNQQQAANLLILLGLVLLCSTSFVFLANYLTQVIYDVHFDQTGFKNLDFNSNATIYAFKLFQFISSLGMFLIPVIIFAVITQDKPLHYLAINRKFSLIAGFLVIPIVIVAAPINTWLMEFNQGIQLPEFMKGIETQLKSLENQAGNLTKTILHMPNVQTVVLNLMLVAVLPALGEELFFRGVLQRLLGTWMKNIHIAIFISAFIFAAIHVQFYTFLPRMLLGVLFGYLFYWSGSIWIPILAHFFHNGIQILVMYLYQQDAIKVDLEKIDAFPLYTMLFSIFTLIILLYFFNVSSMKRKIIN